MTLKELLAVQLRASTEIGGGEPVPDRTTLATYALAWIVEIAELAQELNWKPWKKKKQINRERTIDELADTWAFTLLYTNLVMKAIDATPEEVEAAYLAKVQVNLARGRGEVEGYGRKELLDNEQD